MFQNFSKEAPEGYEQVATSSSSIHHSEVIRPASSLSLKREITERESTSLTMDDLSSDSPSHSKRART